MKRTPYRLGQIGIVVNAIAATLKASATGTAPTDWVKSELLETDALVSHRYGMSRPLPIALNRNCCKRLVRCNLDGCGDKKSSSDRIKSELLKTIRQSL